MNKMCPIRVLAFESKPRTEQASIDENGYIDEILLHRCNCVEKKCQWWDDGCMLIKK